MKTTIKRNGILLPAVIGLIVPIILFWFGSADLRAQSTGFGPVNAPFALQMDEGNSGPEVTKLQTFLAGNSAIYSEGLVTGYFGPLTKAAVMRFQTAYGISPVGRVGPITLNQLNVVAFGAGAGVSGDTNAPIISGVVVNRTSNTASIQWNTNELTRNKIFYSTQPLVFFETSAPRTEPVILGQQMADDIAYQSNFHSLSLLNLVPGATYYYMIESIDQAGNVSVTWPQTFTAI